MAYIDRKIELYGGRENSAFIASIIRCEAGNLDPDIQSRHIQKDGTREQSFGLAQIHLPSHPSVSREMASDPEFAISFIVREVNAGHEDMWTCARIIKSRKGH